MIFNIHNQLQITGKTWQPILADAICFSFLQDINRRGHWYREIVIQMTELLDIKISCDMHEKRSLLSSLFLIWYMTEPPSLHIRPLTDIIFISGCISLLFMTTIQTLRSIDIWTGIVAELNTIQPFVQRSRQNFSSKVGCVHFFEGYLRTVG